MKNLDRNMIKEIARVMEQYGSNADMSQRWFAVERKKGLVANTALDNKSAADAVVASENGKDATASWETVGPIRVAVDMDANKWVRPDGTPHRNTFSILADNQKNLGIAIEKDGKTLHFPESNVTFIALAWD